MSCTKISRPALTLLIISAVVLISMPAFAFNFGKGGPTGGKDGFSKALSMLDLSDDQKTAIEDIRQQAKDSIQPLIDEISEIEFPSTILAESINTEEVNQKIETIAGLRSSICTIKMNARLEAAKELTADQRLELLTLIENMQKKREKRRGKRNQWKNMF